MTTTARPQGPLRGRTPRVLLAAGLGVGAAVVVATVLGGLLAGRPGALGALVGGSIALCFFLFGSLVVGAATRMAPQAALVVALTTYTLQVALVALVFVALGSSDAVGTTLSGGWLAGGVVAATVAWTLGQLVATGRARVPVYDIDLPDASSSSPETAHRAPSRGREAGAP